MPTKSELMQWIASEHRDALAAFLKTDLRAIRFPVLDTSRDSGPCPDQFRRYPYPLDPMDHAPSFGLIEVDRAAAAELLSKP